MLFVYLRAMNKEQYQTIKYYQRNKVKFKLLTVDEIECLKESLGDFFSAISYSALLPIHKGPYANNVQSNWKSEWNNYRKAVRNITKQQPVDNLPNADKPRAKSKAHFHSSLYYVIDHKISIWYGYKNNILPEVIGDISNLRWITTKENSVKGIKCIMD